MASLSSTSSAGSSSCFFSDSGFFSDSCFLSGDDLAFGASVFALGLGVSSVAGFATSVSITVFSGTAAA